MGSDSALVFRSGMRSGICSRRRFRHGSRFPDTVGALRALARRYRLAIISNIDDDLFIVSARQLGVPFDAVVTAGQARCYKPHPAIFEEALRRLGAEPSSVVHVAEGATEIAPMRQLGCATVWVRRNGALCTVPHRRPGR